MTWTDSNSDKVILQPTLSEAQGVYRTLKVVFHDFPGPFYVRRLPPCLKPADLQNFECLCLTVKIHKKSHSTQNHLFTVSIYQRRHITDHMRVQVSLKFYRTFQDHLCPFSMSFQDCLIGWLSNKSDFHIHVLNQLPCACKANMFQMTINIVLIFVTSGLPLHCEA